MRLAMIWWTIGIFFTVTFLQYGYTNPRKRRLGHLLLDCLLGPPLWPLVAFLLFFYAWRYRRIAMTRESWLPPAVARFTGERVATAAEARRLTILNRSFSPVRVRISESFSNVFVERAGALSAPDALTGEHRILLTQDVSLGSLRVEIEPTGKREESTVREPILVSVEARCRVCKTLLLDGTALVFCGKCFLPHHEECATGHCAAYGCGKEIEKDRIPCTGAVHPELSNRWMRELTGELVLITGTGPECPCGGRLCAISRKTGLGVACSSTFSEYVYPRGGEIWRWSPCSRAHEAIIQLTFTWTDERVEIEGVKNGIKCGCLRPVNFGQG